MSEYCKNCFELAEKLTKKERECNTLKSQLDFAVRQKERFEQQCEALKSEGFTRESLITEQENEIDELKHENEELKEEVKREIKNTVDMERLAKSYGQDMLTYKQKKQIEIEELRQECEELKQQLDLCKTWYRAKHGDIRDLLGSYRKALEEIEEYCDKQIAVTGDLPFKTTESDILDIINKAKGKE